MNRVIQFLVGAQGTSSGQPFLKPAAPEAKTGEPGLARARLRHACVRWVLTCAPYAAGCQFLAKFRQNGARFWLYRHRFLQENMRFAAFFKIYQIIKLKFLKFGKILQILRHLQNFAEFSRKLLICQTDFLLKF